MSNSKYDHIIRTDHYSWEAIYHLLLKPPTFKNQLRWQSTMWVYHLVLSERSHCFDATIRSLSHVARTAGRVPRRPSASAPFSPGPACTQRRSVAAAVEWRAERWSVKMAILGHALGSVLNVLVRWGRSRVQVPVGAQNNLLISDFSHFNIT